VTHASKARRQGVAACANSEAARRFLLLVACLFNMVASYHQRPYACKIETGILIVDPYQPAARRDLMQQNQLEFLRLNPVESKENTPLNHRPPW